jgi:hypothetical protein
MDNAAVSARPNVRTRQGGGRSCVGHASAQLRPRGDGALGGLPDPQISGARRRTHESDDCPDLPCPRRSLRSLSLSNESLRSSPASAAIAESARSRSRSSWPTMTARALHDEVGRILPGEPPMAALPDQCQLVSQDARRESRPCARIWRRTAFPSIDLTDQSHADRKRPPQP